MTYCWIREVLADLELFARANDLEVELVNSIAKAAEIAKDRLPPPDGFDDVVVPRRHLYTKVRLPT
jgi:hypothetical protein